MLILSIHLPLNTVNVYSMGQLILVVHGLYTQKQPSMEEPWQLNSAPPIVQTIMPTLNSKVAFRQKSEDIQSGLFLFKKKLKFDMLIVKV